MKSIVNFVRRSLGRGIAAIDSWTSPKQIERSQAEQAEVDRQTQNLKLYQFQFCPFCIKVRRTIKRLNLKIELRDVDQVAQFKNELLQGGGEYQVPCLRIEKDGQVRWLYESAEIMRYLEERFANRSQ